MRPTERQLYFLIGAPVVLALVAFLCLDTPIERTTYCADCGIRKEYHRGRLWGVDLGAIAFQREAPTHLSELYRAASNVPRHLHRWRPTNCPVLATDVNSERGRKVVAALGGSRVVPFVRDIDRFSDPATSAKWHGLLANAVYLEMLDGRLRFCRFPAEGFGNRAEFMNWWRDNASMLYRELEITPYICC